MFNTIKVVNKEDWTGIRNQKYVRKSPYRNMKNMVPFLESKNPEDIVLLLELREIGSKERSQENIQLSMGV